MAWVMEHAATDLYAPRSYTRWNGVRRHTPQFKDYISVADVARKRQETSKKYRRLRYLKHRNKEIIRPAYDGV
jgi:hypothetical protein